MSVEPNIDFESDPESIARVQALAARRKSRLEQIDRALERAGFKRGSAQGALGYVGTKPAGNIRYKRR